MIMMMEVGTAHRHYYSIILFSKQHSHLLTINGNEYAYGTNGFKRLQNILMNTI